MSYRTLFLVLNLCCLIFLPKVALAASFSIDPDTGTYGPGDTFIATVRIDGEEDCVNAVNVAITYSKETLRAVDFSRGDSILSLWAVEPHIDTDSGSIVFAGGVPGGYCGRITGDPALSNVLGKVVFTVVGATTPRATIHFAPTSAVFLNDGLGTLAKLITHDATITLSPVPTLSQNPWLKEVAADTIPPQPFVVEVESTIGVFGGKYYIVFSTTDKESGLDYFEIFERGGWRRITSPYLLEGQSLLGVGDIQVRALDKAGNIRMGTYSASLIPQRQFSFDDFMVFIVLGCILILFGVKSYIDRKKVQIENPPL